MSIILTLLVSRNTTNKPDNCDKSAKTGNLARNESQIGAQLKELNVKHVQSGP